MIQNISINKISLLLIVLFILSSHDMFLKLDNYYLEPDTDATIALYNGTFTSSENTIDRNRMLDISLVGEGSRNRVDTSQWTESGGKTILNFTTGASGTWIAGVSTRARNIALTAKDFNDYLEHDGVMDMLDWRKQNNTLDQNAVEKYSKHVKTIFQVGDQKTDDWKTELGYPIEFIPLDNPYELNLGDQMRVKLLWQGQPLADQLVYAGNQHIHDHEEDHNHEGEDHRHDAPSYRTDNKGMVTIDLEEEGHYYLRTIYMTNSEAPGLTHESNWATLTFQLGHGHSHGLSVYTYWLIIILALIGILVWLRLKSRKR